MRQGLQAHRQAVRKRVLKEADAIASVSETLEAARDHLRSWDIEHKGWPALRRVLKRGISRVERPRYDGPFIDELVVSFGSRP